MTLTRIYIANISTKLALYNSAAIYVAIWQFSPPWCCCCGPSLTASFPVKSEESVPTSPRVFPRVL